MKINTDAEKIKEIMERGVVEIYEKDSLLKKLQSGKKLRIKFGIDPTGPKIHLGRAIPFWKLRALQDMGHKIVLIIGDFTARIGDASDKDAMRKILTVKEIKENMKDYTKQIGKILDMRKVELQYNNNWLGKMKVGDLLSLTTNFTAQQMIQRRNFKERWDASKPIGIHELLYPIFQGYDSYAISADVEIGGTDQLFNMQAGRIIQKIFNKPQQDIITNKMLNGLDGRKMSTSWGNIVTIVDEPQDMFGKIMSMGDNLIVDYFELCTRISMEDLAEIKNKLAGGENPRNIKARLAKEIVSMYYGENAGVNAMEQFDKIFKEKETPTDISVFKTEKEFYPILDLLFDSKLAPSKSEAKRLVEGGGVEINKQKMNNWREDVKIEDNMVIQAGKRKFIKIKK